MKKLTLSVIILSINVAVIAQNSDTLNDLSQSLRFEVNGKYTRPIKKEKLSEANSLNDLIPYYPTNWITEYISVEIAAFCNGKAMSAIGTNNILSTEQKTILSTIDLASDLVINVKYTYKNPYTDIIENNRMNLVMTVVPEREAEYKDGRQQMIDYLKENTFGKISESMVKQEGIILFTVNEEGGIVNSKILITSGNSETDKLLLEAINNMPKWKPAENLGIKVKQDFVFSVGNRGC